MSAWMLPTVAMPRLGVREDASFGQHVDARLEAEERGGQVGHGGPVAGLELDAQAAAPQRQEIRSVGPHVIDQQGVCGRCPCQGIASIALGFAVAVAIETERGPVAQDGRGAQGRLGEEGPDHSWRKLLQHQGVDAPTLHVPVRGKIPGVQRREVAAGEVPPITLALAVTVAGQLHRGGVAQDQEAPGSSESFSCRVLLGGPQCPRFFLGSSVAACHGCKTPNAFLSIVHMENGCEFIFALCYLGLCGSREDSSGGQPG